MLILVKKWRKPYRIVNVIAGKLFGVALIHDQEEYLSWSWLKKMSEQETALVAKWSELVGKALDISEGWRKRVPGQE